MFSDIPYTSHPVRLLSLISISTASFFFFAPTILATVVFRSFVALISKFLRPDLDNFVTGMDTAILGNTPQESTSNFMVCFVANGFISENRIREMFEQRVINLKDLNENLVYKKLSQYWVTFLGYAFWKTDKSLNLNNHVREYDYDNVTAPKPTNEELLKKVVPYILCKPWESKKSNWEVLVVYPFKRTAASHRTVENQSLVIFRFDHSILDGLSAIGLFRVLFQSPFSLPSPVQNGVQLSAIQKIKLWFLLPYELSKSLPILLRGRILGKRDPSKGWAYGVSRNIPLSTIKTIKQKYSVDFASVLRSCINGVICQMLDEQTKLPPDYIDTLSTLGMPDHPGGTINHMKFVVDDLPLKSLSSLDRLLATDSLLKKSDHGGTSFVSLYLSRLMSMFPVVICKRLFPSMYSLGPSYFLTAVPCTTSQEFMDNIEIVDVYTLMNLDLPIGMDIVIWGINNNQRINVLKNPNVFSSELPLTSLTDNIVQELEELAILR